MVVAGLFDCLTLAVMHTQGFHLSLAKPVIVNWKRRLYISVIAIASVSLCENKKMALHLLLLLWAL